MGRAENPAAWLVTRSKATGPMADFTNQLRPPVFAVVDEARDWSAVGTHHAEPLYTLPNALRAIADDLIDELRKHVNMTLDSALRRVADDIENPEPLVPDEPTGDVKVFDKNGAQWEPVRAGRWRRIGNEAFGQLFSDWSSPEFHRAFGPLKVYEARP